MEHIVVGFDGTDPSFVAVDWAAERAAREPCRIELITVDHDDPAAEPGAEVRDATQRILDRSSSSVVTTGRAPGRMPEALLRAAENADLLVIGTHRGRPVRSAVKGWLPLRTVAQSTVPTVVVPDDWAPADGPILVGVDDDDSSSTAVAFAASEAEAAGVDLALLHAWQMPSPGADGTGALTASASHLKTVGRGVLNDAADSVADDHPSLDVEKVLVQDHPASALLSRAHRAALVVLGTHHRGPLAGALLGSVGQDTLWLSQAPVCVVPAITAEEW